MRGAHAIMVAFTVGAVMLSACAKKQASTLPPPSSAAARPPTARPPSKVNNGVQVQAHDATGGRVSFPPIYFDFDTATLTLPSRDVLARIADYLAHNAEVTLTISGHCDERGTPEYNIALGEERARAARDFLVRMGVEEGRVRTISYGEERPAVKGSEEAAWAKNRRDEWELVGGSPRMQR